MLYIIQINKMSFKAVLQYVLHLQDYYVCQYPNQGLLTFNCAIYQLKQSVKLYGIPYQIIPNLYPQQPQNMSRTIVEPNLNDTKAISSTVLVKYSDQTIALDDWFSFRIEVEGYPQIQTQDLFLQIQLKINNKDLSKPQEPGTSIQTITFRLNDIESGIFNYVEGHFAQPYLSKINFTLLGFISSFKFAKYEPVNPKKQLSSQQKRRKKISSMEQLVDLARASLPGKERVEDVFYKNYIKKLRISQYLIQERVNSVRKQPQQTFKIKVPSHFLKNNNIQPQQTITQKHFKTYLDNYTPSQISISQLLAQMNQIRQQNFNLAQQTLQLWMSEQIDNEKMLVQFQTFGREKYGEMVFKSTVVEGEEKKEGKQVRSYHQNKRVARQMRNRNIVMNNYPIQDVRFQQSKNEQQLVFYQITHPFSSKEHKLQNLPLSPHQSSLLSKATKYQYSQKCMLIVLCHGYQGSSYDMALIKRWIQVQLPDAYYLISRCNQEQTDGDIRKMGKNLAEEIEQFVNHYMEEYQQENVIINLVGHSMGGIIARAAIPHLEKYHHQLGFFCSLSSPHLGYLNGVSNLVKVGLWAIKKFKNIQSLSQLSMDQQVNPRNTFLYQLSKTGHLRYFRKIILLSSYQDSYVSWHSARISTHRSTNSLSKVQQQMSQSIISGNIYGATVHRLDVNFNVTQNNIDSFIGRTAHINLIVRQNLFKTISITIPKLFDLTQFGREGMFL